MTHGAVTWVSKCCSASIFRLFVWVFFYSCRDLNKDSFAATVQTHTVTYYCWFKGWSLAQKKRNHNFSSHEQGFEHQDVWSWTAVHHIVFNLCLFLFLQGTKFDGPCGGLDCSGGCRCNPEKGSRVSHVSSLWCHFGTCENPFPCFWLPRKQPQNIIVCTCTFAAFFIGNLCDSWQLLLGGHREI